MEKDILNLQSKSLWKNRDFVLLFSGQAVSSIGSQISFIAFPLLVLLLTGSPAQAGIVGSLVTLPFVLFGLPAGALVDRWNRKRTMIFCDTGRFLALGSIPLALFLGNLTLIQLYIVAFTEGTLGVFFNLAQIAGIAKIVPKHQIADATSKSSAVDGGANLVGPPIGGFLFQSVGNFFPFLLDSFSYLASVFFLFFIKSDLQEERAPDNKKLRHDITEGLKWLWKHKTIRFMSFLTAGWSFILSSQYLIIIILAENLRLSSTTIGVIFSIAAVGTILGSFFAQWIQKKYSAGKIIIGVISAVTILWPLYIFASSSYLLCAITVIIFFILPSYGVSMITYRLSILPDNMLGRVNGVFRMIYYIGATLGIALAGISLEKFDAKIILFMSSIALLILTLTAAFNRGLRNARLN